MAKEPNIEDLGCWKADIPWTTRLRECGSPEVKLVIVGYSSFAYLTAEIVSGSESNLSLIRR